MIKRLLKEVKKERPSSNITEDFLYTNLFFTFIDENLAVRQFSGGNKGDLWPKTFQNIFFFEGFSGFGSHVEHLRMCV